MPQTEEERRSPSARLKVILQGQDDSGWNATSTHGTVTVTTEMSL